MRKRQGLSLQLTLKGTQEACEVLLRGSGGPSERRIQFIRRDERSSKNLLRRLRMTGFGCRGSTGKTRYERMREPDLSWIHWFTPFVSGIALQNKEMCGVPPRIVPCAAVKMHELRLCSCAADTHWKCHNRTPLIRRFWVRN
ncbi:hypothetical protein ALO41_101882 [Pseudomonas amygdali pv. ulmi]|uniref:Uncharacterized protein n=1 Tax=Pseudomonas amygdali pv. ulmi TaxID=251720 RepID=A0A0N8TEB0_PSEA0|nr:hypothetical protein ALO41_101882 [Pseudomonas amygdali pv. ulmi]